MADSRAFQLAIDKEYLTKQYAGMSNYQNRKSDLLLEWYALQYTGKYDLKTLKEILELGCGDGTFWKYALFEQSFKPHITMTDLVRTMLADCQNNLATLKINAHYQTADIDALPFDPGSFNAVLAHKVIYHAANPEKSIADIQHILKPNGFLGLSVLNDGAYRPIWKLAHSINPEVPDRSLSSRFNDIDADITLPKYFPEVTTKTYVSTKKFIKSDEVVAFVKTNPIVEPLKLSDSFFTLFKEKVSEEIEDKGSFECEYNSNLYLCQKPCSKI
jgi:2-polyprenyl-3-methyl-5-hydroxy-6-metoxy-1,4-benzoquinol methylase